MSVGPLRNVSLSLLVAGVCTAADTPPLHEILSRLADNQERVEKARNSIVYRQETTMKLGRGGKVLRDDHRVYTVTPTPDGTQKHLNLFEGRHFQKGKPVPYDSPEYRSGNIDLDGEIMEDIHKDLVSDPNSRDGIDRDSFPLTRDQMDKYTFSLAGRQKVAGVDALRVRFTPKKEEDWEDSSPWEGELLVHPEEFQPMRVTTKFATHIPGWVKVVFGISIKQLGFNVTYKKVDEGLWFPHTFGTEFQFRVFFGYARDVTFSLQNSEFRKAVSDSVITYDTTEKQPE